MASLFAQRLRQGLRITVRMIQENGMIPTSPGSRAFFFLHLSCVKSFAVKFLEVTILPLVQMLLLLLASC